MKNKICFDISIDPVEVPHENDILLGRGGNNNKHIGNEQLRLFAMERVQKYILSTKKIKSIMVLDLVSMVRNLNPPGRFLRQGTDGLWYEAGNKFAKEKASQVYRDAFIKTLNRRTNDTYDIEQNSNNDDANDHERKQLHFTKPRLQTKSSLSSKPSEASRTYYSRTKKTRKYTKIHSDEMSNSTLPTESSHTLCKSELEGILTETSHEHEYEHDYDIPFSSNLNAMDINIDPSTYEINLNTNYNLTKITPEEAFDSILGEEFQLESSNAFFDGETTLSNLNTVRPLLPPPPSLVTKGNWMSQTESSSALHVLNPEGASHETDHHNECDYDISYGNRKVIDMNTQSNPIRLDKNYDLTHISTEEVFDLFMDEELTLDLKGFHLFM